jgi:hypothetical protein
MLDQTGTLEVTKDIKPTKATKDSRYWAPPAKITKKLKAKTVVDWQASKDVNATALLIAGCHANQTSADTSINGQPCGAATAALLKSANANTTISYKTLVTEMSDFMVTNKYAQIPELDGDSSLYDQTFVEPFSFTIAPGPVIEPMAPSKNNGNSNKIVYAIATVAAIIVLFLVFA